MELPGRASFSILLLVQIVSRDEDTEFCGMPGVPPEVFESSKLKDMSIEREGGKRNRQVG